MFVHIDHFTNMNKMFICFCLFTFTASVGLGSSVNTSSKSNDCILKGSSIHCKGLKGKFLSGLESESVRMILITSCDMSMLTQEDFAAFPEVTNIEIRASNLSLPKQNGLFNDLKYLTNLQIVRCYVGDEVAAVFQQNHFLKRLSLRNNRISSISHSLFKNLRKLEEVDLSENNASRIEDGAFDGLEHLKTLNISNNALYDSSSGVAALSTTRCKVCRPKGNRNKCTKQEVEHCVSGRPLDSLWWRAAALTVHLQGNPLCDELLEIPPSGELYRGDVECEIQQGEGECFQQRRLFLEEACNKASESIYEREPVLEGGTMKVLVIVCVTLVAGIVIGVALSYFKKKLPNVMGRKKTTDNFQSTGESVPLVLPNYERMEKQMDSSSQSRVSTNNADTISDDTELHSAALKGDLKTLKMLKKKGVDLTMKNSKGESALWCAALAGQQNVVQFLLKYCPEEVHSVNQSGDTPLHIATRERNEVSAKLLLRAGAKRSVKNKYGSTPLHMAVSRETMGIIELLLEDTECINETNAKGETPLSVAVGSGQVDAVILLLKKGASVRQSDLSGLLPIQIAAWNGNKRIVDLLLEYDSPINSRDVNGNTVLHDACRKGHTSIVQCLLDRNFDINARNEREKTPLHKAVKGDHVETVQLLLQRGAEVDAKNVDGLTPLEFAIKKGSTNCTETIKKYSLHKMK